VSTSPIRNSHALDINDMGTCIERNESSACHTKRSRVQLSCMIVHAPTCSTLSACPAAPHWACTAPIHSPPLTTSCTARPCSQPRSICHRACCRVLCYTHCLAGLHACSLFMCVRSIVHVRVMSTTSLHVAHTSISMCACTIVVDPHDHVVHLHSRITSHN
jgi:hypothetical protein